MDHSFFEIAFSYVVDGKTYYGELEQHGPMEIEDHFSVLYNPENPSVNSFSKVEKTVLSRVVTWSLGIALGALLIYLQRHFNIPTRSDLFR